jgi:hypothetical protein
VIRAGFLSQVSSFNWSKILFFDFPFSIDQESLEMGWAHPGGFERTTRTHRWWSSVQSRTRSASRGSLELRKLSVLYKKHTIVSLRLVDWKSVDKR